MRYAFNAEPNCEVFRNQLNICSMLHTLQPAILDLNLSIASTLEQGYITTPTPSPVINLITWLFVMTLASILVPKDASTVPKQKLWRIPYFAVYKSVFEALKITPKNRPCLRHQQKLQRSFSGWKKLHWHKHWNNIHIFAIKQSMTGAWLLHQIQSPMPLSFPSWQSRLKS